ncbi:MAG: nucleotide exchange factor GrpE [Myxococcaceae bacterium]
MTTRVNDRRRFDEDGNPRPFEAEPADSMDPVGTGESTVQPSEPAAEHAVHGSTVLEKELEVAWRRIDQLARAYQALTSDREEFKQRLARERDRLLEVEKGNLAAWVLETVDELDLALRATDEDTALASGVRLIRDQLLKRLAAQGVERMESVGKYFDPSWAEAADMEMTLDPQQDQRVVAELRAGYRLGDRVLRAARVKVAKYVQPAQA